MDTGKLSSGSEEDQNILICVKQVISPAVQAGISAGRSACPAFGEGSRERIQATWRADA